MDKKEAIKYPAWEVIWTKRIQRPHKKERFVGVSTIFDVSSQAHALAKQLEEDPDVSGILVRKISR